MIKKRYLVFVFFVTVASVASGDDDEIVKDLEFFKSYQLVKNMDSVKSMGPSVEMGVVSKVSEVNHEKR